MDEESELPKKAPYVAPKLILYGKLAHLTQGTGGNGKDANGTMTKMSDPRLKDNIRRIGHHPLGFGLYLFDYRDEFKARCGAGRYFGVMADEVELVIPKAVTSDADGFRSVNYGMLGIELIEGGDFASARRA